MFNLQLLIVFCDCVEVKLRSPLEKDYITFCADMGSFTYYVSWGYRTM